MVIVTGSLVLLFVILGVVFAKGKGLDLVAGYNTLSEQEKKNINKKAMSKYMSRCMFALAACLCVVSIGIVIEQTWLSGIGFGLFLGTIIFFVIYLNTGNRLGEKE